MLTRTARLSAILSSALEPVVVFDRAGDIRGWNDRAERSFGWAEQEVLGEDIVQLLAPLRHQETYRGKLQRLMDDEVLEPKSGRRALVTARHKNGRELPVEVGLMPAGERERGEVFVAFIKDLSGIIAAESHARARGVELSRATAQKAEVEERLEETEELYRYTIELSTLVAWTADPTGRAIRLGTERFELNGSVVPVSEGTGWVSRIHPDDIEHVLAIWYRAVDQVSRFDSEYRVRTAEGGYRWCHARAAPRLSDEGAVIRWYGTLEDVDERKLAETTLQQVQAELVHVSRLSAMGAMASTLAHELNQPLTAITNFVRGSQRALAGLEGEPVEAVREALEEADRSAMRASEVIRSLRALVGKGEVQRRGEDLPTLIHEACRMALVDAASLGISCRLDLDEAARAVSVDRVQIQQVLVNLLRNAVEALRTTERREIVITTVIVSEECCQVSLRDSGPGVSPEAADRLFQSFNSTKENGMGIGLSISRTIVEAHAGQIWYEAGVTGGAIFHLLLPRA